MTATRTPVTLLDGGTGSELRRRGVRLAPAAWSATAVLEHRSLLTAIHRDYIDAGADVITANTFSATPFVLEAAGVGDRTDEIVRASVAAARAAVHAAVAGHESSAETARHIAGRPPARVAAALSCYPARGDRDSYPSPDDERAAYGRCAQLAAAAGADLLVVEMLQDPDHGERACRAAADSGLPFWIGLSCRRDRGTGRLVGFDLDDVPFESTLERLLELEPAAVTVMHSPLDVIDEALELIGRRWAGPRGAYAEIPYPDDPVLTTTERHAARTRPVTPAAYAECASRWLAAGATIIGGCCGTTPAHVAALRRLIDRQRP